MEGATMRVVATTGLAILLFAATGASAADYTDPAGDAGGAPDVTAVAVDLAGTSITFRVSVANMAELDPAAELFLAVDTDRSTRTGDRHGVDFVYSLRDGGATLRTRRWSGAQHVPFGSSATGAFAGGVATFVVQLAELGDPAAIGFGAIGTRGADADAAPGNGSWPFRLRAPLGIRSVTSRFAPVSPRAGRAFRIAASSAALNDGTTRAVRVSCVARLAGAPLAGRGCSWRLPATARGKRLTVGVRAVVPDVGAKARTYAFRVR
jgi:hypothetical protein